MPMQYLETDAPVRVAVLDYRDETVFIMDEAEGQLIRLHAEQVLKDCARFYLNYRVAFQSREKWFEIVPIPDGNAVRFREWHGDKCPLPCDVEMTGALIREDERLKTPTVISDLRQLRIRLADTLSREDVKTLAEAENRLLVLSDAFKRFDMPDATAASGEDAISWAFAKDLAE